MGQELSGGTVSRHLAGTSIWRIDKGIFSGIWQSMTEVVLPLDKKQNVTMLHDTNVDRLVETACGKVEIEYHNRITLRKNIREFEVVFVSCGAAEPLIC